MVMDSLRKIVDKQLKGQNKYLFESTFERSWEYLKNYKNWWIIAVLVLFVFFCLQFINLPFLNFIDIKEDTVKPLIENRTTNIVTLISVTFAVIGFLIANLAIKDSFTYNMLFRKSTFFLVVYIALSLIVAFIILSTLKDTLKLDYQSRTLMTGTFLLLFVIFCVGHLFTQLIKFTNLDYLLKLTKKELLRESKENLKIIARKQLSATKINELGFSMFSYSLFTPLIKIDSQISQNHNTITDIIINELTKIASSISPKDEISIKGLWLDKEINSDDGFFFVKSDNFSRYGDEMRKMNSCIVTKEKKSKNSFESKDYVVQKLNENIMVNNERNVKAYFDILFEAYKLQQDLKI
jgi:hypothetical protein